MHNYTHNSFRILEKMTGRINAYKTRRSQRPLIVERGMNQRNSVPLDNRLTAKPTPVSPTPKKRMVRNSGVDRLVEQARSETIVDEG